MLGWAVPQAGADGDSVRLSFENADSFPRHWIVTSRTGNGEIMLTTDIWITPLQLRHYQFLHGHSTPTTKPRVCLWTCPDVLIPSGKDDGSYIIRSGVLEIGRYLMLTSTKSWFLSSLPSGSFAMRGKDATSSFAQSLSLILMNIVLSGSNSKEMAELLR